MAVYEKTVDANGGADYPSGSAWVAGEQSLYTASDEAVAVFQRSGSSTDTTPFSVAAFTAKPKITVDSQYYHEGYFADTRVSDGNYICKMVFSTATNHGILITESGTEIDGLLITGSTGQTAIQTQGASNCLISNVIVDGHAPSSFRGAIRNFTGDSNIYQNCIVANCTNSQRGFSYSGGTSVQTLNCMAYGNSGRGFEGGFIVKNCVAMANTVSDFSSNDASSDYNVSSDTTAPGTNVATSKTSYSTYFVDHTNSDFHLKDTSSNLWGLSGTDLSGTFTTDIDNETRSNWDIGADEYIAAGSSLTSKLSLLGVGI